MRRLVADLLLLARADAGRVRPRQPVDLRTIARDAVAEAAPLAGDHDLSLLLVAHRAGADRRRRPRRPAPAGPEPGRERARPHARRHGGRGQGRRRRRLRDHRGRRRRAGHPGRAAAADLRALRPRLGRRGLGAPRRQRARARDRPRGRPVARRHRRAGRRRRRAGHALHRAAAAAATRHARGRAAARRAADPRSASRRRRPERLHALVTHRPGGGGSIRADGRGQPPQLPRDRGARRGRARVRPGVLARRRWPGSPPSPGAGPVRAARRRPTPTASACRAASRRARSRAPTRSCPGTAVPVARLPGRAGDVRADGRRLGARLELRVAGRHRRRVVGDPLRRERQGRRRLPDPRRHERQLRGRPDAVGHVALVRGVRRRPGLGGRPARPGARASTGRRWASSTTRPRRSTRSASAST